MCGIAGYINHTVSESIGRQMAVAMLHRGPDCQDARVYTEQNCCLAHARLSIIDLSSAANQPMEFNQLSIVFNGEVYNYQDIRKELTDLGHQFRLNSDTEVILHAYQEWGAKCVDRFIGMFAFAILDREQDELLLFRDRAGVKPLYYYSDDKSFIFGSELKALKANPLFHTALEQRSVGLYFKYGYVPSPYSIYQQTSKLMPGHYLRYDLKKNNYQIHKYWDVLDYYRKPKLSISYEEAKEELTKTLKSAFNYRMVADVPVGVFLSGGYDSTVVTALLQKDRTEKLKTFTIGFPVGTNEAPVARNIAELLGTDHTEYICTQKDCKDIIPELPFYYDEPFADNSAVPTMLVSRIARQKVKVSLSADAGDETFAGYNRYAGVAGVQNVLKALRGFRSPFGASVIDGINKLTNPYSFYREKGEYLAEVLRTDPDYRSAVVTEGGSYSVLMKSVLNSILKDGNIDFSYRLSEKEFHDPISVAQAIDYISYMADDILVKVDRAAMSSSLEGREPLLDHRIIEFAATLPTEYKYKDGVKKRILKDIAYNYVPKEILDRPKTGFMMPVDGWLRGDLRYLLEENINEKVLDKELFNVEKIMKLKELYLEDKLHHENKVIWRLLMFQMWYRTNF